jgi:hypothetical protein
LPAVILARSCPTMGFKTAPNARDPRDIVGREAGTSAEEGELRFGV